MNNKLSINYLVPAPISKLTRPLLFDIGEWVSSNSFIFIKINKSRRRFFKPFQNKWVMIYSIRDRFYMNYTINILPKDFNPKEIISIANSIGFKNINEHIKIDNYTTNNI